MPTALEAMEQAKEEAKQQVPEQKSEEQKQQSEPQSGPSFMDVADSIDDAAKSGDIERLRKQNRELALAAVPENMRAVAEQVLDLREAALAVETDKTAIAKEKHAIAIEKVVKEFGEFGVKAELLSRFPDEKSMREIAEEIKAARNPEGDKKDGEEANPPIMKDKPTTGVTGNQPGQPRLAERYKRAGLEAGLTALLGGLATGEE